MGLRDFVEAGRVAFVNYGDDFGKMLVIVDIVDMGRVLVDGLGNFPRVIYPLKRLTLTRLRIPILRGARTGTLRKAAAKFELDKKWKMTPACQKMTRQTARANTTDFERFQVMVWRKQRGYVARRFHKKAGAKPAAPAKAAKAAKGGKKAKK